MAKLGSLLVLLLLSMLAAGLYGAVHNRLTYSVGPDYFHQFKFPQFGISTNTQPRLGAALVGWRASWWMGLVVGLVPFLLGLFLIRDPRVYLRAGIRAIIWVVLLSALSAAGGFLFGVVSITPQMAAQIPIPDHVSDPISFLRAGVIHDTSYLGGFLGLLLAIRIMFRSGRDR